MEMENVGLKNKLPEIQGYFRQIQGMFRLQAEHSVY